MLRLTFLGTSSSRPTVRRNVSGLAVHRSGELFLFDCGEGTQRQMMRFGVGFAVKQVFITHIHADHYLGLTGLLRTMTLQGRQESLVIWGPANSFHTLNAAVSLGGDRLSFAVDVRELPAGENVRFDGFQVESYATDHMADSIGLVLREDDRYGRFDLEMVRRLGVPEGPLFGRLQRGDSVELDDGTVIRSEDVVGPSRRGRWLCYTGDTRPTAATVEAARGADLLVHEATFSDEERARAAETRHSTARQAAEIAGQAGVRELVITHFSARHSEQVWRLQREAAAVFSDCRAADDGMSIEILYPDDDTN